MGGLHIAIKGLLFLENNQGNNIPKKILDEKLFNQNH